MTTNTKLTDERPDDEGLELLITIRREIAERHASEGRMEQCAVHTLILNALLELQERRKADSDPVGEFYEDGTLNWYQISDGDRVPANRRIPLYRHAQPVPERERIRREHAEWSDATFGDVGPIGPLKHLSKEALEAAAVPSDPLEWADMQFLLWDAQRRAGITDEQITQAMIEKLAINKARQWPEPKDGEPRLHIKEQPAPVVPDGLRQALSNAGIAAPESDEMLAATCEKYIQMLVTWVKDRKPFQPAPVSVPDGLKQAVEFYEQVKQENTPVETGAWKDAVNWVLDEARRAALLQANQRDLSQPVDPQISEYEKIMLQAGNSPVTPDGWISCSELMPEDEQEVIVHNKLGYRYVSYFDEHSGLFFDMRGGNQMNCIEHILVTHWMPLPAAPQQ